jgi:hypothetical protein
MTHAGADGSDVEYGSGDNDDEGRGTDYMDEDQDADEVGRGEKGGTLLRTAKYCSVRQCCLHRGRRASLHTQKLVMQSSAC